MICRRFDVRCRRGLTLTEVAAMVFTGGVATALVLPALGGLRGTSQVDQSLTNLAVMGLATQSYAADWNGRQPTWTADNLAQFGNSPEAALLGYEQVFEEAHPPILVGWSAGPEAPGLYGYYFISGSNSEIVQAIDYDTGFGHFRFPNAKSFHDYVGGRWYDERFYAPADTVPYALAEPWFDDPSEYITQNETRSNIWSSYCMSPAAMLDPGVLRAPSLGGFQDPWSLVNGLRSPALDAALFPDLKTHIIEHHWLQGPPADCNPAFPEGTYMGCEPYYFNHGLSSSPATLFYDGHVRLLPNLEVQAADQQMLKQTGGSDGLWSRDTPLGADGYFLEAAFDTAVDVSHHVLTTGGITGRDTTASAALLGGTPVLPTRVRRGFWHGVILLPDPPVAEVAP